MSHGFFYKEELKEEVKLKGKPKIACLVGLLVLVLFYSSPLLAGTTGKIAGVVKDADSGSPLPGWSILSAEDLSILSESSAYQAGGQSEI